MGQGRPTLSAVEVSQQSKGLPISLRPHQVTWTLRAIQSISMGKSTAPEGGAGPSGPLAGRGSHDVVAFRNTPKLVSNLSGPAGQYCTSMAATGQQQ